jgi:cold shock CspA family protein
MAKSHETWNKKEAEKKKQKKRQDKEQKKEDRKANAKEGKTSLDEMMAYVDEYGNITSTPPDPSKKIVIKEEDIEINIPRNRNATQQDVVRRGIVTFFNDSKGYGFIKDQESQDSIFVHLNGLVDSIKENNKVTFEVEMGPKGPNAVNVKVVR